MNPVTPNPLLGVGLHSVGAMFAANCYAPQKYIRRWSWEVYWIVQAAFCWLAWPILGAIFTIPHLWEVLAQAPKSAMVYSLLMGLAYGIGGTAFNLSIRYIGFALTYAIAVGLSSVLGTFVTPLLQGRIGEIMAKPGSGWVLGGVAVGTLGIGLCGMAGRWKEADLRDQEEGPGDFSWSKGLSLSLLAGVLSSLYGIAITDVAKPIVDVAEQYGAGHWKGNVAYLFVNPGAFLTALFYCLWLAKKNRTLGEFKQLADTDDEEQRGSLTANYLLAIFVGTLWYGQFFFYNLGHVRMGAYEFSSWAIHMIMLVLFSNLLGVIFKEWKGCRGRTLAAIVLALIVLVTAILFMTYGNHIGG